MKKQLLFFITTLFITSFLNAQVYMYGTTSEGGANGLGTIYRTDQNGQNFQKLFDFNTTTGGMPLAGLTLANNGKLYGFTTVNGQMVNPGATLALGAFFEFDPLTNVHTVVEYIDDQSPFGHFINYSPLLGTDGLLYFTAENSPSSFDGLISSYNPASGIVTVLDTFTPFYGNPRSKLLEASNGHFYITTYDGGANGKGAIVRYNTNTQSLERMHSSVGYVPNVSHEYELTRNNTLIEASDGYLYGCSREGGQGYGNIFRIMLDGTNYGNVYRFSEFITDQGYHPTGFVEKNGKLYGTTAQEEGFNVNSGTVYALDLTTQTLSYLYTLDLEGARPLGTFVESTNGRLYVTCNGGSIDNGSLIEFNTINDNVTQRQSFDANKGEHPHYNQLTLVDFSLLSVETFENENLFFSVYPNPTNKILNIKNLSKHSVSNIQISDLSGRTILEELILNNSRIDISNLQNGLYLITIELDNNKKYSKKFIVKN